MSRQPAAIASAMRRDISAPWTPRRRQAGMVAATPSQATPSRQ